MPPWHADPRYGHFANDRSLTAQERATLLAWVDQGTPLGDPTDLPRAADVPRGLDDRHARRRLPDARAVSPCRPQGMLPYQHFRVPTDFTEDVWVQAAEARPGDRSVVHHICVFVADRRTVSDGRRPTPTRAGLLRAGRHALGLPSGHRQADPGRRRR